MTTLPELPDEIEIVIKEEIGKRATRYNLFSCLIALHVKAILGEEYRHLYVLKFTDKSNRILRWDKWIAPREVRVAYYLEDDAKAAADRFDDTGEYTVGATVHLTRMPTEDV